MAITHLLDTSVYCQPLKRVWSPSAVRRWRALGDDSVCISSICLAELLQGLESRHSPGLWSRYEEYLNGRLPVLPVDERVAETYAKLYASQRRAGTLRPQMDLLIAATASAHGLVVATLNAKDFSGIEGVAVEDWSV